MSTKKEAELTAKFGDNLAEGIGARPPAGSATPAVAAPSRPARLVGVEKDKGAILISMARLAPDPDQPRKEFTEEDMEKLVSSLRDKGQLQPIRVRWDEASDKYLIIMGERRYRAAIRLGLPHLQAIVHDKPLGRAERIEIQLDENLVREELKPVEIATQFRILIDECGYTQERVGRRYRMTQSAVSQYLSLLGLDPEIQQQVEEGTLSTRTAQHIARVESPEEQKAIAAQVVEGKLTESQTARVVRDRKVGASKASPKGRGGRSAVPKLKTELPHSDSGYKILVTRRKGIDKAELREVLFRWWQSLPALPDSA